MTAARTRAQIGAASRRKGAAFERATANALRPWWPDIRRSRDNGSATTTDTGDLDGAGPGLWWSLKDVAAAHTDPPALIGSWLSEAREKASGRLPLVVQKRAGHRDPLRAWAWLWLDDLVHLTGAPPVNDDAGQATVRMTLRDLLPLLAAAGYTATPDRRTP